MKNSLFGVIIKVNDLDLCRKFYRDVLNLGDPVLDSSFWVEFQTDDGFFADAGKDCCRLFRA